MVLSVEVVEHNETPSISDPAIEQMPERIVEKQSTNVDIVSQATNTSNAILTAVDDALSK